MKKLVSTLCFLCALSAYATDYYCNPSGGSMSNAGTLASPWSTLQAVVAAGKTFAAGDMIYLLSGNHGFPVINKTNSGNVTITKYPGNDPVINRIDFTGASRWVLDNVTIYTTAAPPEPAVLVHPVYPKYNNTLVRVTGGSSYISLSNCLVYSIENSSAWTTNDWNTKAWNGVYINGNSHHVTINSSTIRNVNFAIEMAGTQYNTVQHSLIENFCGDGIRPGSYNTIEYTTIRDVYATNGNHYDLIQGFASTDIVIRGNILTNATSNRPFLDYSCQGIGLFDGYFTNFVIENNLVVLHHYHGISLYGARNCRVVNNTVVKNPVGATNMAPWIGVFNHKDGSSGTGNIMSNNLVCDIESTVGTTLSNNIITAAYTTHFVNYTGFDMHLKAGSGAINAGTTANAPATDLEKKARTSPYDVGCYEYGVSTPDAQAPTAPTNLAAGTITSSSVALSWTASTDNIGVAGYDVYQNNILVKTVATNNTTITGLVPATAYSFYIKAKDAAGNHSTGSNTVNATTLAGPACTGGPIDFTNTGLGSAQTGAFVAEYDVVAGENNMDGVVALSNGTVTGYPGMACIVRFNTAGQVDVRNGGAYGAVNSFSYTAGIPYHVRLSGNISSKTYSVYIKPSRGSEVTIASNYAFRSEQAAITHINNRVVKTENSCLAVSNFSINDNVTTGVDDSLQAQQRIRVYPNPVVSGSFYIELGTTKPLMLRIVDLNGKLVYTKYAKQSVPVQLTLPKGIYIISAGIFKRKIIVH